MLKIITDEGKVFEVKTLPHKVEFIKHALKMPGLDAVMSKIATDVDNSDTFCVSTRYCNPWPAELTPLFSYFKDEELSAKFLGLLTIGAVISSSKNWLSTKSNFLERKYETMFYWESSV